MLKSKSIKKGLPPVKSGLGGVWLASKQIKSLFANAGGGGGIVPDILHYDNIIFFGASIIDGAFTDDSRLTAVSPLFADACGLSGVNLFSKSLAGATSNAYKTLADELIVEQAGLLGTTLIYVHGPGNDISNGRPFATDTTIDYAVSNMRYIFDLFEMQGWGIAYSGVSWRT